MCKKKTCNIFRQVYIFSAVAVPRFVMSFEVIFPVLGEFSRKSLGFRQSARSARRDVPSVRRPGVYQRPAPEALSTNLKDGLHVGNKLTTIFLMYLLFYRNRTWRDQFKTKFTHIHAHFVTNVIDCKKKIIRLVIIKVHIEIRVLLPDLYYQHTSLYFTVLKYPDKLYCPTDDFNLFFIKLLFSY